MNLKFALLFWANVGLLSSLALGQQSVLAPAPTATKPIEKGAQAPTAKLQSLEGKEVDFVSLYKDKPLVVVFFRGGWCPICTKHTQELIKAYPQLKESGYEMIGISPDTAENSKLNVEKSSIPFAIYSDSQLKLISAFGLAFKVDDATVEKYKGFGIDLEKASGQNHHGLPIPAVYIISPEGVITYAHSNPDYRQRLDVKELLKVTKKS